MLKVNVTTIIRNILRLSLTVGLQLQSSQVIACQMRLCDASHGKGRLESIVCGHDSNHQAC